MTADNDLLLYIQCFILPEGQVKIKPTSSNLLA